MATWKLVDCLAPLDEGADNPTVRIDSEAHLRAELERLRQRIPGHVLLVSPHGDGLSMSVGGPWISFGWVPAPTDRATKGQREAINEQPTAAHPIECQAEGVASSVPPELLFPAAQAAEAIVHFYLTRQLPRWVAWREWEPAIARWKLIPAERAGAPVSA